MRSEERFTLGAVMPATVDTNTEKALGAAVDLCRGQFKAGPLRAHPDTKSSCENAIIMFHPGACYLQGVQLSGSDVA